MGAPGGGVLVGAGCCRRCPPRQNSCHLSSPCFLLGSGRCCTPEPCVCNRTPRARFVLRGVGFGWASRHWRVIGVFLSHENHHQSCLGRCWARGSAGGLRFMPLEVVLGGWHACRAILFFAELGAVLASGIHAKDGCDPRCRICALRGRCCSVILAGSMRSQVPGSSLFVNLTVSGAAGSSHLVSKPTRAV